MDIITVWNISNTKDVLLVRAKSEEGGKYIPIMAACMPSKICQETNYLPAD